MSNIIDLRSDTVTAPSDRMRRAMAEAEVGDDVYGEDPTVNRLEARCAELFGREAGLFVPTGSMGNLVSILTQTSPGEELICDAQAHIVHFEMGSPAAIAGVMPRPITTDSGILSWPEIEAALQPDLPYVCRNGLICLENSHNLAGGTVYPIERVAEICDGAYKRGLRVHVDGARIFNAAAALGRPVEEITRGADSVTFCFSKGLGAPVGSMVVGSKDFIAEAWRVRKRLGGGMRQVGVLAAAALVALEDSPARLVDDHAHARMLAEALAEMPGIEIDLDRVVTNILFFSVAGTGMDSAAFSGALTERGVRASPFGPKQMRMVTHQDVSREQTERAIEAIRDATAEAKLGRSVMPSARAIPFSLEDGSLR